MARKSQDHRRVEFLRKAIAERLAALESEMTALRSEDCELETTERVLVRLSASTADQPASDDLDASLDTSTEGEVDVMPDGQSLTIGDMALLVLSENRTTGLTSNEILEAIRARWLPDLMRTSLSPPLSRLKKKLTIRLDDEQWLLTAENGPPNGLAGPDIRGSVALGTPAISIGSTPTRPETG